MKRALSRNEWVLLVAPILGIGTGAAFLTRWKSNLPASLDPSPVRLFDLAPTYNGKALIGSGIRVDAKGAIIRNAPHQILRWDVRTGHLGLPISKSSEVWNLTTSRDGELIAFYRGTPYNRTTRQWGLPMISVLRTADGSEVASWPSPEKNHGELAFSPDGKELVLLGQLLQRYQLTTGKKLASASASQFFPTRLGLEKVQFSPDGHLLAVIENQWYAPSPAPSPQLVATSVIGGGRLTICEFPSLRVLFRASGDLYASVDWETNSKLWAVAPLMAGTRVQKLVRAHVDITKKQTHLEALELPSTIFAWAMNTLAVNGATGRVLLSDQSKAVLWERDGQQKAEIDFHVPTPSNLYSSPVDRSLPQFMPDGQSIVRIKGTDIERYDLSRFLSEPASTQTSGS